MPHRAASPCYPHVIPAGSAAAAASPLPASKPVDMVRHQALSPDLAPGTSTRCRQQAHVLAIVIIAKEGLLTAVTPLRHMMRITTWFRRGKCYVYQRCAYPEADHRRRTPGTFTRLA
ncbi:MAG: hypothetical protein AW07_03047 [Candidatus Accumulibacter sp. SK-11]|nr:MAG: hypothetical protein AW07_03047 [Candidatus Accumulibacter sp. SK-11]